MPHRDITAYPFLASAERAAQIKDGRARVVAGMSAAEVVAVLGEPDEIQALHAPRKNGAPIGSTHWYVVRRLVAKGSVDEKQEIALRVAYGLDERVLKVDAWGMERL